MSDTPRTDALWHQLQGTDIHYWWQCYQSLAQGLEKELQQCGPSWRLVKYVDGRLPIGLEGRVCIVPAAQLYAGDQRGVWLYDLPELPPHATQSEGSK